MQENIRNLMSKKLGESMMIAQKSLFGGKYIEQDKEIKRKAEEMEQKL